MMIVHSFRASEKTAEKIAKESQSQGIPVATYLRAIVVQKSISEDMTSTKTQAFLGI